MPVTNWGHTPLTRAGWKTRSVVDHCYCERCCKPIPKSDFARHVGICSIVHGQSFEESLRSMAKTRDDLLREEWTRNRKEMRRPQTAYPRRAPSETPRSDASVRSCASTATSRGQNRERSRSPGRHRHRRHKLDKMSRRYSHHMQMTLAPEGDPLVDTTRHGSNTTSFDNPLGTSMYHVMEHAGVMRERTGLVPPNPDPQLWWSRK